jgi:uncharacterized membrane protein (DUF4010 family)
VDNFLPFLVSLMIGFLVGTEREKAHRGRPHMGVRTFTLLSLVGAVAGWINQPWASGLIAAFALGLILISHFNLTRHSSREAELGLTTEIAGGLVFFLAYCAHLNPALTGLLGCTTALVLFWKRPLHRFTAAVRPRELEAAMLLLLLGISVQSVLSNEPVDPLGLFVPRKFGLIILVLAFVEFSSYLTVKFLGARRSPLVAGFLGGLVSSTATILSSGRRAKSEPHSWARFAITSIIAKISSLLVVCALVLYLSPRIGIPLIATLALPLALGAAAVAWLERRAPAAEHRLDLPSPLDMRGILRLSFLLAFVFALVALAQKHAGDLGTQTVDFLGGLFELQGVSLATASLHAHGQLNSDSAIMGLEMAVLASFLSQLVLVWMENRDPFGRALSLVLLMMIGSAALMAWLLPALLFTLPS